MKRRPHILVCIAPAPGCAVRRRPRLRRQTQANEQPAFQYLTAAATAVAAAAALAAAIRAVLSDRTRRVITAGLLRTRRRVQAALHLNTRRTATPSPPTYANRLDSMASRVATQLETDLTTPTVVPTDPELYAKLPPKRRAALLVDAMRQAALQSRAKPASAMAVATPAPVPTPVAAPTASPEIWNSAIGFWQMAEGVNGRLAALGFAVCLLRESLEPTHPSMLAQMKDVLVPVAVHTPPFLVAVVDRMVDWLT